MEKLGQHATDIQKAQLQQRTNALMRQIDVWVKIQTFSFRASPVYEKQGEKIQRCCAQIRFSVLKISLFFALVHCTQCELQQDPQVDPVEAPRGSGT